MMTSFKAYVYAFGVMYCARAESDGAAAGDSPRRDWEDDGIEKHDCEVEVLDEIAGQLGSALDEVNEAERLSPEAYLAEACRLMAEEMRRTSSDGISGWARLFADPMQLEKWLSLFPALLPPDLASLAVLEHGERLRIGEAIARLIICQRESIAKGHVPRELPALDDLQAAAFDSVLLVYFARGIVMTPPSGQEHLAEELKARWDAACQDEPERNGSGSPRVASPPTEWHQGSSGLSLVDPNKLIPAGKAKKSNGQGSQPASDDPV